MPSGIKGSLSIKLSGARGALTKTRKEALRFAKDITPIDTGNARSKTTQKADKIVSAYPYAKRIMLEGWSKQLNAGEYVPRLKAFFQQRLKANMKSRGL